MEDFDRQLKLEFLQEADEIMQKFELALISLKTSDNRVEKLNELFRFAHTLKGSGLAAGFRSLGSFAHKLENLLDMIRSKQVDLSSEIIGVLLTCSDYLKDFVSQSSDLHEANIDTRNIEQSIEKASLKGIIPAPNCSQANQSEFESLMQDLSNRIPRNPTVFVCEDEAAILDGIIDLFPKTWNVKGFESAEAALEQIQHTEPNLIIADLRLPRMSGDQMMREIFQLGKKIPVIFISGHAERSNLVEFMKLGAEDFFEKPFNYDELYHSACRVLRNWAYSAALEEIAVISFRNYMQFTTIDEFIDLKGVDLEKKKKIRMLERSMTKIGKLCILASQFAKTE